jgi:C1A family cysteine protease
MLRSWYWRLRRKTGWMEDRIDDRDFSPEKLERWRPATHWRKQSEKILNVPRLLNQGSIPSCVANVAAYGLMIERRTKKIPSRLFLYWNSRARHQKQKTMKMTGTYIRDCVKQLCVMGVPEEKHWPYSTDKKRVNRQPPFTAYIKAHKAKKGIYCSIKSAGDQRIKDIITAISLEYPVIFGARISREFYGYRPGTILTVPKKSIVGGHALTIVGYSKCAKGYKFRVVNSWGSRWGDNGYCWIDEKYIRSKYCKNFWIFEHGNFG